MKINISYMGNLFFAHLRRDLMLLLKYALEDLGHQVSLSRCSIEAGNWLNIVIGGYFLKPKELSYITSEKFDIVHLNTEIIKDDLLNFNPEKVDFLGTYLPMLKKSRGVLEMVIDNMPEHTRYGTNATFLRWAYHPKLKELKLTSAKNRSYDYYCFGMMSDRRLSLVEKLKDAGFYGLTHEANPFWERNSIIERTKINLNLIQEDFYSHVNAFRIGYLANNGCTVLSEKEHDPANYLEKIPLTNANDLVENFARLIDNNRYLEKEKEIYYHYRKIHMTEIMEQALDQIFQGQTLNLD